MKIKNKLQRLYNYFLGEPFYWITWCLYRPKEFIREIDTKHKGFWQRIYLMLRLGVPMFLYVYPLVIILHVLPPILQAVVDHIYPINQLEIVYIIFDGRMLFGIITGIGFGLIGVVTIGVAFGLSFGLSGGLALGVAFGINGNVSSGVVGVIIFGLVFGLVFGLSFGVLGGSSNQNFLGLIGGLAFVIIFGLSLGLIGGLAFVIIFGLSYTVSYVVVFLRLPLYPIDCFSIWWAYIYSHKHPSQSMQIIQKSALYWDEMIYLPLPGLKQLIELAAAYELKDGLTVISYILTERKYQVRAAFKAFSGLALGEWEKSTSLREIAATEGLLGRWLEDDVALLPERVSLPFARLNAVAINLTRFYQPISHRNRLDTLVDALQSVNKIVVSTAFTNQELNKHLSNMLARWKELITQEQLRLEKTGVERGEIENPYDPGLALNKGAPTFAGRTDISQVLNEALGRRKNYLTFMLSGERRMGKTSALRQLSKQLGARIVTVVYDLQQSTALISTAAFFNYVAGNIFEELKESPARITRLDYELLRNARNSGEVYEQFSTWLSKLEKQLEKEDLVLLLTFDEFEKLEENAQNGTIDLRLLLNWFRSTIQNFPRLAFLFSGVKTIAEMSEDWAGYFVNVKTLRVSYLRPAEARQLVLEPKLDFPGQIVFGYIASEIIRITGGHPFLIQAICAALIDNLNYEKRESATQLDLEKAVNQLFDDWENYFVDLWKRTTSNERVCLEVLEAEGQATADKLEQVTTLPPTTIKDTLKILLKRDLIQAESHNYKIATPIFREWVKRNLG